MPPSPNSSRPVRRVAVSAVEGLASVVTTPSCLRRTCRHSVGPAMREGEPGTPRPTLVAVPSSVYERATCLEEVLRVCGGRDVGGR